MALGFHTVPHRRSVPVLAASLCLALACATPLEREQKASAPEFARSWLELVDARDQDAAWEAVGALTRERFEKDVALKVWFGSRHALGARLSQHLTRSWKRDGRFLRSVPEDGSYWEIRFNGDFEHRRDVREALLLVWEDDEWHLLEYGIR